jgi:hypothetical protein
VKDGSSPARAATPREARAAMIGRAAVIRGRESARARSTVTAAVVRIVRAIVRMARVAM